MAKFVNLKKRSVALPKGFKNLIDLLRPGAAKSGGACLPRLGDFPKFPANQFLTTVEDVESTIARVNPSPDGFWVLVVSPVEGADFAVSFIKDEDSAKPTLSIAFQEQPILRSRILGFLADNGLERLNPSEGGLPSQFPGIPVYESWTIAGELPDLERLGSFAQSVLLTGMGLPPSSRIALCCERLL